MKISICYYTMLIDRKKSTFRETYNLNFQSQKIRQEWSTYQSVFCCARASCWNASIIWFILQPRKCSSSTPVDFRQRYILTIANEVAKQACVPRHVMLMYTIPKSCVFSKTLCHYCTHRPRASCVTFAAILWPRHAQYIPKAGWQAFRTARSQSGCKNRKVMLPCIGRRREAFYPRNWRTGFDSRCFGRCFKGSSFRIVTGYSLDDGGIGVVLLTWSRSVSLPRRPDRLWGTCSLFSNCKIWGFHGGDYEEWCLLGCYAVWLL
jgi:hypothetical protein